ncbi:MAG: hypothetical protein IJK53_09995 [Erysipelotrichaceae bacterium]|nr:hypothetical protein [Clostridia bacterium]MBQ6217699.1 hypothetical protein [Erysipelotrichaceae bacterium]
MNWKITTIICLIAFFIVFFGRIVGANIVSNKLISYLYMNETEKFDQLRRSKLASTFISRFNLRYIDFSKAMMEADEKQIENSVSELEKLPLNINQRSIIYTRCFYYYLSAENYHDAKKYYQKNYDLDPDKYNPEMDMLYDIYIKKGSRYLDELIEEYQKADEENKAKLAAMLSKIYENMNDKTKAEEYLEIAAQYIEKMSEQAQKDKESTDEQ